LLIFFRIKIPSQLRGFVIGPQGSIIKGIQQQTRCRVVFPNKDDTEKPVELISSVSEGSVLLCRDRIELIMREVRHRAGFTHFVSLSMAYGGIKRRFCDFCRMESCRLAAAFQKPARLHLTLTMLTLLEKEEEVEAVKALDRAIGDSVSSILEGRPLEAEIKGLDIMNDDPTRARVLYACASSDRLQKFADAIANAMRDAGFAPKEESVKLHMTLSNVKYAVRLSFDHYLCNFTGLVRGSVGWMDVSRLLEKYRDFLFGRTTVREGFKGKLSGKNDGQRMDGSEWYWHDVTVKVTGQLEGREQKF
uniref:KH domain-containing protein n=1 Tax=Gongylonema pulchrum TaxID=637853 RepID=A0A183ECG0_9BILA